MSLEMYFKRTLGLSVSSTIQSHQSSEQLINISLIWNPIKVRSVNQGNLLHVDNF